MKITKLALSIAITVAVVGAVLVFFRVLERKRIDPIGKVADLFVRSESEEVVTDGGE